MRVKSGGFSPWIWPLLRLPKLLIWIVIRLIAIWHRFVLWLPISANSNRLFPARSNLMNLTSARAIKKATAVAEPKINISFSVSTKETEKSIPRLSKTSAPVTLQPIIKGKVSFDATVYTDGLRCYDSIVHLGYQKHFAFIIRKVTAQVMSTSTASKVSGDMLKFG